MTKQYSPLSQEGAVHLAGAGLETSLTESTGDQLATELSVRSTPALDWAKLRDNKGYDSSHPYNE